MQLWQVSLPGIFRLDSETGGFHSTDHRIYGKGKCGIYTLVLFGGSTAELTTLSAASLLVFCLLYTPCVAAIASIKRELGAKWAVNWGGWDNLGWLGPHNFRGFGWVRGKGKGDKKTPGGGNWFGSIHGGFLLYILNYMLCFGYLFLYLILSAAPETCE